MADHPKALLGLFVLLVAASDGCVVEQPRSLAPSHYNDDRALGLKNGFRESRWGAPPEKGMLQYGTRWGMPVYARLDDNKRVARMDAFQISYMYWRDGLCVVEVGWLVKREDGAGIVALTLRNQWGVPSQETGDDRYGMAEWDAAAAETRAFLWTSSKSEDDALLMTLRIEQKKCSDEARGHTGL